MDNGLAFEHIDQGDEIRLIDQERRGLDSAQVGQSCEAGELAQVHNVQEL